MRPLDLLNPDNLVLRWTRNHIHREIIGIEWGGNWLFTKCLISHNQNKNFSYCV